MDAKPASTPADSNDRLMKDDGVSKQLKDKAQYQSMVGSLFYAAMATRPDIAQAVGAVSKFCALPIDKGPSHCCEESAALLKWH